MAIINLDILHNFNNKPYKRSGNKAGNGVMLYSTECEGCGLSLEVQKFRVKEHKGKCRSCALKANRLKSTKGIKKRTREEVRELRLKRKEELMKKRKITVKSKPLGVLINEFDNMLDNSVDAFNDHFDEYIGGDQSLEVEILEPYTHNGRILLIGGKEVRHLFFDERDCEELTYFIDVHNKDTDEFIKRYKSFHTVARDYQRSASLVLEVVHGHIKNPMDVTLKKVARVGKYKKKYCKPDYESKREAKV